MQHVAVFLADDPTLRRLRSAFKGQCQVEVYPAYIEAVQPLIDYGRVLAVIVDLRPGAAERQGVADLAVPSSVEGDPAISLITALHTRYPALPIVGYVDFTPQQAREILWAAHAGVSEIILREFDDLEAATRRVLNLGRIGDVSFRAISEISAIVPSELHDFFSFCVSHAHKGVSLDHVAGAIQIHKKTIAVRLRRRRLPPPHRILGWGRVLAASRWLEDPTRSVEKVARELHFSGGAGLRNFLRRYVGCRPEVLREQGGFSHALRLFVRELREPWNVEPKSTERTEQ